ncbi:MAG: hypothetical protein U0V48_14930 [Anaerolineales bacterium]
MPNASTPAVSFTASIIGKCPTPFNSTKCAEWQGIFHLTRAVNRDQRIRIAMDDHNGNL